MDIKGLLCFAAYKTRHPFIEVEFNRELFYCLQLNWLWSLKDRLLPFIKYIVAMILNQTLLCLVKGGLTRCFGYTMNSSTAFYD